MALTKNNFASLIAIFICLVGTGLLYKASKPPKLVLDMQEKALNIDTNVLRIIDIGQHRMISSLMWSETLLKSDIKHYKGNDFKNWMFLRLKTITDLDPYFFEAYLNGAVYLSIIKDDDLGAEYIYDKGRIYYPLDYYLNLNAAFHYYFELGKVQKSIDALEAAKKSPNRSNPRFVSEMLAKMKSLQGNKKDALILILNLYESAPKDSVIQKKYHRILYSLKAEIDLECLNSIDQSNCQKADFENTPYLKTNNGRWKAAKEWKPYKIKSPSNN